MKQFNYEKRIFAYHTARLSLLDPQWSFLRYYKKELAGKKRLKILDIGCGAGGLLKGIQSMYPQHMYSGCDITKTGIKEARKNAKGIHFFVGNAEKLPLVRNSYDVVIMNSILDHLEYPEKAVKEAYRVLKKGGIFLSVTPIEADMSTLHGYLSIFKTFRKHRFSHLGHIHAFTKKTLLTLIAKPGFSIENVFRDWQYFAQAVDLVYYPLMGLFSSDTSFSLHSYGAQKQNFRSKLIEKARNVMSLLQNVESLLCTYVPFGFFVYVKAIKK